MNNSIGSSLKTIRYYFAVNKSSNVNSSIIVQPLFFQKTSLISKIIHKYKNLNTLTDIERTFRDFNRKKFQVSYLKDYNDFIQLMNKRQYREFEKYLSEDIFKKYKSKIKKNEEYQFELSKAKQIKIVQARTYATYVSSLKTIGRWFQLTCEFIPEDNSIKSMYHVLERGQGQKLFKIIKLDLY